MRDIRFLSPAGFNRAFARKLAFIAIVSVTVLYRFSELHAESADGAVRGQPFTRFYTFDEIGGISRGPRLSFDPWGRIVAVHDGTYHTLNDDVWLNAGPRDTSSDDIQTVARDSDNTMYYGGTSSWGILERVDSGKLVTRRLAPLAPASWVLMSNFYDVLCRPEGIYFIGNNGLALLDRATKQCTLHELPGIAGTFTLGGKVYISSHGSGVWWFDPQGKTFSRPNPNLFGAAVIDHAAELADGSAWISTTGRALLLYHPDRLEPLPGVFKGRLNGRIVAMDALLDGNIAVAIANVGLYIATPGGEIVTALTGFEYRGITSLATNEAGVLWAATETGIAKILYGSPVTSFGQALGLPVNWPQVVHWNDQTVIASAGRLYESVPRSAGEPTRFRLVRDQPAYGVWGVAVYEQWLLASNATAVFARAPGQPFMTIVPEFDGARLVTLASGVVLVIGPTRITAVKYQDGAWVECASRIPGPGYPSLVHVAPRSVWFEIGANRAARLTYRDGQLQVRSFESFPWAEPRWVNISVVGDTVVLSGDARERLYFDEKTEDFVAAPPLKALLDQAPNWILRIQPDDTGALWASYEHGVFTLRPKSGGLEVDTATYAIVSERNPLVQTLPGPDVWITNGSTLYHVDRPQAPAAKPQFHPTLVSVRDRGADRELLAAAPPHVFPTRFAYGKNSLTFRFFAGSYASRRTPNYEFRLNQNDWSRLDSNSLLTLSDLREGDYALDVRLVEGRGPIGPTMSLAFVIAPPWFRTWYAYAVYATAAAVFVIVLIRLALRRARTRNAVLERLVEDRTEELRVAMKKLQRETQTAATLAERNRLAGEIHDSLEQGFSGLIFQLETTAAFTGCPPEVKGGLSVARNMVAFCRNEIRHAVWDLQSPLLESGGLETALKAIIAQLGASHTRVSVSVAGAPRSLGSTTEHHLLRIAQEAIANAVKHAAADHIEVKLDYGENEVALSVRDDGRGFDPQSALSAPAGHFGLRSLRGRANKIGATLEVTSAPGAGACVTVHLQLKAETV